MYWHDQRLHFPLLLLKSVLTLAYSIRFPRHANLNIQHSPPPFLQHLYYYVNISSQRSKTEPRPYPALSLALSTRDRHWYISASASADWGGWLNARMLQFCSVKGLSLNQAMVDDAGVPLTGSYMGIMVLLYKPETTARQGEHVLWHGVQGAGIFRKISTNTADLTMGFEFKYL